MKRPSEVRVTPATARYRHRCEAHVEPHHIPRVLTPTEKRQRHLASLQSFCAECGQVVYYGKCGRYHHDLCTYAEMKASGVRPIIPAAWRRLP